MYFICFFCVDLVLKKLNMLIFSDVREKNCILIYFILIANYSKVPADQIKYLLWKRGCYSSAQLKYKKKNFGVGHWLCSSSKMLNICLRVYLDLHAPDYPKNTSKNVLHHTTFLVKTPYFRGVLGLKTTLIMEYLF